MATKNSDSAQKSELVPQNKRFAMGVPLTGKSMSGGDSKKSSGLDSLKKK